MDTVIGGVARRHILDHYPGVKCIGIWVDAGQVGTLEKALAVATMMVVVMV